MPTIFKLASSSSGNNLAVAAQIIASAIHLNTYPASQVGPASCTHFHAAAAMVLTVPELASSGMSS